jgi:hypothetical protein
MMCNPGPLPVTLNQIVSNDSQRAGVNRSMIANEMFGVDSPQLEALASAILGQHPPPVEPSPMPPSGSSLSGVHLHIQSDCCPAVTA